MKRKWLVRIIPRVLGYVMLMALVLPLASAQAMIPEDPILTNQISLTHVTVVPKESLNMSLRTFEVFDGYIYGITWSSPKVYRSSDGINFNLYSNTLLPGSQYTRLVFAKGNMIAVRENSADVITSTDNGTSWNTTLTASGAWFYYWSITKDSSDNVFLATYGLADTPSVYRSTDGGLTWATVFELPAITHFHEIAVDPYTDDIWAVTGDSLLKRDAWRSVNSGDNWTKVIPNLQFAAIEFTADSVVLGTDMPGDDGIYVFDKSDDSYVETFHFPAEYNWEGVYELKRAANGIFTAFVVRTSSNPPEYTMWRSHNLHDWYLADHRVGAGFNYRMYVVEFDGYLYILDSQRIDSQVLYDAFASNWWDSNWADRIVISYNATALTENLTNFVSTGLLTPSRIDFSLVATNGTDLRVVDQDDITPLAYDITSWNGTAGSENFTILWNKPSIPASSNYTSYVYLYFNNPGASDNQSRNAVWANTGAGGVWDMYNNTETDNQTGTSIFNAVSTNNTGTSTNTTWGVTGRYFGGVNSRVQMAKHAAIQPTANVTIEVWYRHENSGVDDSIVSSSWQTGISSGLRVGRSLLWGMGAGNGTANDTELPFTVPVNTWAHTALVRNQDSGTFAGSYNGTLTGATGTLAGNIDYSSARLFEFGVTTGLDQYYRGTIGEVRVYNRVRSGQELLYTFRSEQEFYGLGNGGFLYYGGEDPEPSLTTLGASGISMDNNGVTSGNFSGNLTSLGGIPVANVWFDWALQGAANFTNSTASQSMSSLGTYNGTIPSTLTPGATYVYRASSNNTNGYGYGANVTFTLTMPTPQTQASQNISMTRDAVTSGFFSGNITSMGASSSTNASYKYGLTDVYGSQTTAVVAAGTGNITLPIPSNLTPGQTYHFALDLLNGTVNATGGDGNFTLTMPSVTTNPATSVQFLTGSGTTATLNGDITSLGVASDVYAYFDWGLNTGYGQTTTASTPNATGTYATNVTGFVPDIVYHYRAVNRVGSVYSYGSDQTFYAEPTANFRINNLIPLAFVGMMILAMITIMTGPNTPIVGIVLVAGLLYIGWALLGGMVEAIARLFGG